MQVADDLAVPLNDDQRLMLRAVWSHYSEHFEWPTWRYVVRWLGKVTDVSPLTIRDSFPVVGTRHSGPSYSAIQFDRYVMTSDDRIKLTIVAGLHLPECEQIYAALVKVIGAFAERARYAEPDEGAIVLTDEAAKNILTPGFHQIIPQIPPLLHIEPRSFFQHSGLQSEGTWQVTLSDDLVEYVGVQGTADYVQRTTELILKDLPAAPPMVAEAAQAKPQSLVGSYINESLIDELSALDKPEWHVGKLAAMLRELNINYDEGHAYSSMMLFRAILDHIPPVFGFTRFSDVANQASGLGETDKKYLKQLASHRFASDDVMHRQIRKAPDLIELHDMPQRAGLNALIRLVVDRLK